MIPVVVKILRACPSILTSAGENMHPEPEDYIEVEPRVAARLISSHIAEAVL
jgi:hypothetical protein